MKTNKAVIVDGGEQTWKPGAAGTRESSKEILSEQVTSSYQQKSTFSTVIQAGGAAGARGAAPAGARPGMQPAMPAASATPQTSSGVKIIGHAVQVIQYDKIVSESYIEPALKELVGSSGTKPGPAFAKPEAEKKAAE